MAYHDDLLDQALHLVHKERRNPKQASLRRAVSTAYYALFHLLMNEAVANWNRVNLRAALGRAFRSQRYEGGIQSHSGDAAIPIHRRRS
jgi:hypothetical protein